MLKIWTAAKADIIREALDLPFARLDQVPDHQVVPFEEGVLVDGAAGDVILTMGAKPLGVLQEKKIVRKGRTVDSLRQTAITGPNGCAYLTTLDPFLVRTRADAPSLILQDVALAARLALTGSCDPVIGDYRYVDDFTEFCLEADRQIKQHGHVQVACDTETKGLHPEAEGARLITIQFSLRPGSADVLYIPPDGTLSPLQEAQIRYLLTCPQIYMAFANGKFDCRWIYRHWGIRCTNFTADTLIMGSMLNENRSNSLKSHAWEYTQMGGYENGLDAWLSAHRLDKGDMEQVPKDVLLDYAGPDPDVTLQCATKLKKEIAKEPYTMRLYRKIIHPAAREFEMMEHEGVVVDVPEFLALREELTETMQSLHQKMVAMMPMRLRMKHSDNLSVTRAAVLKDFFFSPYGLNLKPLMMTPKGNEPSTAKAHLMLFLDDERAAPFVKLLAEFNSAAKTRSSFVDSFLDNIRSDGKLHPVYQLFVGSMFGDDDDDAGATTGRTSCKHPAFQTVPSRTVWAKKLRKCYPALPGHLIAQLDFAQGELKIVACVANEENMIAAFKQGLDLHTVTGAQFMKLSYEGFIALEKEDPQLHKKMRTGAKAGNFGLLYGMQAPGFKEYARVQFDFQMTLTEAEERRHLFLNELYPGLTRYHEDAEAFVRRHGYIESPLGCRRHLPLINSPDGKSRSDAVRQAINAPIQSTLNHLTFWALVEMKKKLPHMRFFGMIHDSLLAYIPIKGAEQTVRDAREIMSTLPIAREMGWDPALPLTADAEMGPVLSGLEKLA